MMPGYEQRDFLSEAAAMRFPPVKARVISLWQPWASLMRLSKKTIETRSWATRVRGEVFIHAAQSKEGIRVCRTMPAFDLLAIEAALGFEIELWASVLPFGKVIARGELVECMPIEDAERRFPLQRSFGDFTPGRYGHLYRGLVPVKPVQLAGRQGFFFSDDPTLLAAAETVEGGA